MIQKKFACTGIFSLIILLAVGVQTALATVSVQVQPPSLTVFVGSSPVLTASANATAGEVITGYTWLMSSNGLNPFITVGSGPVLTVTNIQASQQGFYFVRVNFTVGTNQSTIASTASSITVNDQARITGQPQSIVRIAGAEAPFSVSALGAAPLIYQWRFNGTNLTDGGRISGATGPNLLITGLLAGDSGNYDVVVSNIYAVVTSQVAVLSVLVPPFISVQPPDTAVILGSNTTISVIAGGSPVLAYRWQKGGTNLSNGGRFSGTTTDTLQIASAITNDAGIYSVTITNALDSITSSNATLTVLVPANISSSTNAAGKQGHSFSNLITATGTGPFTFGTSPLPTGLGVDPVTGLISGIPAVSGTFDITVFATNVVNTAVGPLHLYLETDVPGITSSLVKNGKQGQFLSYTITASNDPVLFSATGLPTGVNLNPLTGVIAGPPIVSGSFPVIIGASNQYGSDSKTLTINLSAAVPGITSAPTATGAENQPGFTYTITASNSPTLFDAIGLPLGLSVNTNTGVITGTPLYGGPFTVLLRAANEWGVGTSLLLLNIAYATNNALVIADVAYTYSKPYLLDFSFSLRDDPDPGVSRPIVRPPSQFQVVCMEDGVPLGTENAVIFDRGNKKQLRSFLVLDYTFSMFFANAIDSMQTAAKTLIHEEPANAQFGIYEFHADYVDPKLVTSFTSDKAFLNNAIDGIQSNYVQGNYAGTRCFDALYAALGQFGPTNRDELRYVVVMTDGNDDSSLLNTNASPINVLVGLAQTNQIRIYCVAYGTNINVAALQQLTSQTLGHYYEAATTADLPDQFLKIVKEIDGQYLLRWATLKRANKAFQPSFQITLDGLTATYNTNVTYVTNITVVTNPPPAVTNITVTKVTDVPDYLPPTYAGDVRVGSLRLVTDADIGPRTIRLRSTYAPRFVRELRVNFRANYGCIATLASTGPGEILSGWSMTATNDGAGGVWLTLLSPNVTNLLTSIPYGALGDLVSFQFLFPEKLTAQQAFSAFSVDNTIYTNLTILPPPTGQSFVLENTNRFVTPLGPPPPHGTPIPWLIAYGFTNNFDAAELSDPNTNGLAVWQEYLAGLNPLDPNSKFTVRPIDGPTPGQHQIIFSTVMGRKYRVESAVVPNGSWTILRDNIDGIGGDIVYTDLRDLSGVNNVYYRVAVY